MAFIGMHLYISGRVQGVAFRYSAIREARNIGVTGWVRNRHDGRVELLIEGEEANVIEMLEWCYQGPPGAQVTDVEIERLPYSGNCVDFELAY